MLTSTATGCPPSFAPPVMLDRVRPIQMMRSLQTTLAMSWLSMVTRSIFASSDPSSQETTPMTCHLRPHFLLIVSEIPVPGPGLAPILDPGPIPGRRGPYPKEAPPGPLV